MKIALAQIKVRAGRPDVNFQTMLDFCRQAAKQQADLIVFPELAMSGSFLGQAWASPGLLAEIQKYNQKLITASSQLHDAVIVFGSIGMVKTPDGQESPTSAIYVAQAGKQLSSPAGSFQARVNGQQLAFALLTEQQSQPAAPIVLELAVLSKLCRLCQNLRQNAGLCQSRGRAGRRQTGLCLRRRKRCFQPGRRAFGRRTAVCGKPADFRHRAGAKAAGNAPNRQHRRPL